MNENGYLSVLTVLWTFSGRFWTESGQICKNKDFGQNLVKLARIKITHAFVITLTLARSPWRCLNSQPSTGLHGQTLMLWHDAM